MFSSTVKDGIMAFPLRSSQINAIPCRIDSDGVGRTVVFPSIVTSPPASFLVP